VLAIDQASIDVDLELAKDFARFYADPLGFVMYAFPWDSDASLQVCKLKSKWAKRFRSEYGPDEWACQFLDDLGEMVKERGFDGQAAVDPIRMAVSSGHGVGKSAMTGWLVTWIMCTRPYAQGTVTANTFQQLETKTWAQIKKWMKLCVASHWFEVGASKITHKEYPEQWFVSAQTCREENSESFAGQHAANSTSFYINDEASAIPDKIFEVQDGGLTDGEPMQFNFGNPTRNTGRFRECWRRMRHRWRTYKVDSRSVQITNKTFLQELIDDYGLDSDIVKVRVLGDFPKASFKQFISEEDIDNAWDKHLQKPQYDFAPVILTCDPAWTGEDELVIAKRQGLRFDVLKVLERNDNDVEVASVLAVLEDEYKADAVFVDGGFGTGIVSAGKAMNRDWNIVWFSAKSPDPGYLNLRSYMWGQMKAWLKDGGAIPPDETLRQDLAGPETLPRLDGKIQLEAKEQMKKRGIPSPNRADALALSFAMPVAHKEQRIDIIGQLSTPSVTHDFDPYAMENA